MDRSLRSRPGVWRPPIMERPITAGDVAGFPQRERRETPLPRPSGLRPSGPAFVLVLIALLVLAGDIWISVEHQRHARQEQIEQLEAVGDLQKEKIEHWLELRRDIAWPTEQSLYWGSISIDPGSGELIIPAETITWAESLGRTFDLHEIEIHHAGRSFYRNAQVAIPAVPPSRDEEPGASLDRIWSDAHGNRRMVLRIEPVHAPPGTEVSYAADPDLLLGRILGDWQNRTETAESLIAWRDEAGALRILNASRSFAGPENEIRCISGRALAGEHGLLRGVDYSGVEVTAIARPIEGTDWVLIVKIDDAELAARAAIPKSTSIIALMLIVIALLLLTVFFIMRWRDRQHRRIELEFRTVFQHAPIPMVMTKDGVAVDANDSFCDCFGWTPSEVPGLDRSVFFSTGGRSVAEEATRELVERGVVRHVEIEAARKDGSVFPVEINSRRLLLDDGAVHISFITDLSARVQVQEALRAARDEYRMILEGFPNPIWQSDASGSCIYFNRAWLAFTGRQLDELLGDGWIEDVHPADREDTVARFVTALSRRESFRMEYRLRHHSGSYRWLFDCGTPLTDADGTFAGYVGSCYDIHDERLHARELAESEERFRSVVEKMRDGLAIVDAAGAIEYHNPSLARMLGERLQVRSLPQLVEPEFATSVKEMIATPASGIPSILQMRSTSGEILLIEALAGPIGDGRAVALLRDVTEKRKLQETLERSARMDSLGRISTTLAHEFNNLLMAILPMAEALRYCGNGCGPRAEQIIQAVYRGRAITHDILRFTGTRKTEKRTIELWRLMDAALAEARGVVPQKVRLSIRRDEKDAWVSADAAQLTQALLNLTVNAVQAMPDGGELSIETSVEPGLIAITVRDSGAGISPELQEKVFEPLFTTKSRGTGLGLSVVRQAIEAHGGVVLLSSSPGEGTTFRLELPTARPPAEIPESEPTPASEAARCRLLLVEDDPSVADGLGMMLEMEGHSVEIARSGNQALEILSRTTPDAVVLDVGLPDIDGTEVFARMRASGGDMPVVFSTGHLDRTRLEKVLAEPRVAHLMKPYRAAELLTLIERMVAEETEPALQ